MLKGLISSKATGLSSIACLVTQSNVIVIQMNHALKTPKNLSRLFNEINSFSSDINNTQENIINSNYYNINQL